MLRGSLFQAPSEIVGSAELRKYETKVGGNWGEQGWRYYYASNNYHDTLVYDGMNISAGSAWKMQTSTWTSRPVFNSSSSSVLFDFFKRARWNFAMTLLIYTVKGQ